MAIIDITSAARCKDCQHLVNKVGRFKNGRINITYYCGNANSPEFEKKRAKRDLVCNNWEL